MKEKDSRGHWWEWVDQKSGTMDCGFACTATVCRYYLGTSVAMDLTKGKSQIKPGAGKQGGTGTLQNLADVLHSQKVGVWDAQQMSTAALVGAVQNNVSKNTPAILGVKLLGVRHLTVAIEVDTGSGTVLLLDPDPTVGLVEVPLTSFPSYATRRGTGTFDGWILCTKPKEKK